MNRRQQAYEECAAILDRYAVKAKKLAARRIGSEKLRAYTRYRAAVAMAKEIRRVAARCADD
jgi:hypothetical protein